ncbi:MAG: hypothetical protein RR190_02890 [Bacteroidales bacterium]
MQKRFYQQNPSARPPEEKEEGEVNIDYIPPHEDMEQRRPAEPPADSADYVDFEEVNEVDEDTPKQS